MSSYIKISREEVLRLAEATMVDIEKDRQNQKDKALAEAEKYLLSRKSFWGLRRVKPTPEEIKYEACCDYDYNYADLLYGRQYNLAKSFVDTLKDRSGLDFVNITIKDLNSIS